MLLSGVEIKNRLGQEIKIEPFNEEQLNPNSYNLRLHNELLVYDADVLDMKQENTTKLLVIPPEGLILKSNRLYLGRTLEYTETQNLIPAIEGRSSVGRLGVSIHISAPYGNVGFKGFWTLEITCVQPIRIYPGIEICQIFYHTMKGDSVPYTSKYQGNNGIQSSKLYQDFQKM